MIANVFSGVPLDRASHRRGDEAQLRIWRCAGASLFVPVWQTQSLVRRQGDGFTALLTGPDLAAGETVFLGLQGERAVFAVDLAAAEPPAGGEFADLRQIGGLLPRDQAALLAYGRAMLTWHGNHRFCGRCGGATVSRQGGHLRHCPHCRADHFPRTDPAVIMLVQSGDHCLLGRQAAWPAGMMSTLAGFVEPGETPEEAVAREVLEETGVAVARVCYHSSQPWPFPGSLMIGFVAETDGRPEPRVDHQELEAAAWFDRAQLRNFAALGFTLPRPHSIARRLIEDWLAA